MFVKRYSQILQIRHVALHLPQSLGLSDSRSFFVLAWHILVAGQRCGKPAGEVICQVSCVPVPDQLFRVTLRYDNAFLEDQPSAACPVRSVDEVKSQCLSSVLTDQLFASQDIS
jgi:hypothetical protein